MLATRAVEWKKAELLLKYLDKQLSRKSIDKKSKLN